MEASSNREAVALLTPSAPCWPNLSRNPVPMDVVHSRHPLLPRAEGGEDGSYRLNEREPGTLPNPSFQKGTRGSLQERIALSSLKTGNKDKGQEAPILGLILALTGLYIRC